MVMPLFACGVRAAMPPIGLPSAAPVVAGESALDRLPPLTNRQRPTKLRIERDSAADLTRVSVTTHPGMYFRWVQRPRLTFFVVHNGTKMETLPPVVTLTFRTQSP